MTPEDLVKRGIAAQKGVDRELAKHDLNVAIGAVQTTLEHTDEDETRTRMKCVLKLLQRTVSLLEES